MPSDPELERIYQRIADRAMAAAPKPCQHRTPRGQWCPACAHEQRLVVVSDYSPRQPRKPCTHGKSAHSKAKNWKCQECKRAYERDYYHRSRERIRARQRIYERSKKRKTLN